MEITLLRANIDNVKELHAMQIEAFKELLEEYQDFTFYDSICMGQKKVGAIQLCEEMHRNENRELDTIFKSLKTVICMKKETSTDGKN